MTAYALVDLNITNVAGMLPYIEAVGGTISAHGGKYLVRPGNDQIAGNAQMVEGGQDPFPVKVIIEFPTLSAGHGWYSSPEYQAILPYRLNNASGKLVWVEGIAS